MSDVPKVVGTLIALLLCGGASPAVGKPVYETKANVMVEVQFEAHASHDDPFNTVSVDVVFADPNGKELKVPAFWAGGKTWKVRYASSALGTHQFRSECSDAHDSGLHGVTGSIHVTKYSGDNSFYRHGPIQ